MNNIETSPWPISVVINSDLSVSVTGISGNSYIIDGYIGLESPTTANELNVLSEVPTLYNEFKSRGPESPPPFNPDLNRYSVVGGGLTNNVSNVYSVIGGGKSNTSSGYTSYIGGGANNTASGKYSIISGGRSNTASGYCAIGGGNNSISDRNGQEAYGAGAFSTDGDAQRSNFILRGKTTEHTPVQLFPMGNNLTYLTIPNGKVMSFIANVTGTNADGSKVSMFVRQGVIKNIDNVTSICDTIKVVGEDIQTDKDTGVSIAADNTYGLVISVTGIVSEIWRWVANVQAIEIGVGR